MNYRPLGNSDTQVSELGLGTMTFGEQNSQSEAHLQLDIAVEHGVNLIDSAEMYPVPPNASTCGLAEKFIGTWLRNRGRRDDIVLATKATGPGRHLPHIRDGLSKFDHQGLILALDGSLARLQTDYVDLYQLHWPDRATNTFGQLGYKPAQREEHIDIGETLRALSDLVVAGKVRYIGLSNETPWGLMSFVAAAREFNLPSVVSIQNPYNLLNRSFEVGLAEIADREQIGLLAYSPLGFGTLTGKYSNNARPAGARISRYSRFLRYTNEQGIAASDKYLALAQAFDVDPAQLAISFVLSRRYVSSVLIGATNEAQLRHNLESSRYALSKEQLKAIDKIHKQIPNPCP
ncbi:MAG: aryl-alcohol dehydrogenase-like predicted oxidoreductase [Gammaproteobacteria bacterium]|jgi:aryl-alcohol dehydrogenase-like predicted oxidoreductase